MAVEIAALEERGRQLEAEVATQQERGRQLEAEVATQQERRRQLKAEVVSQQERGRQMEAEVATQQERRRQLEAKVASQQERGRQLEAEVAAHEDAAARVSQSLSDQLRLAHAAYRDAATNLDAIRQSTTWRMTAPVRGALSRNPAIARFGRRALKFVWWTATGQIGTRLKARKAASTAGARPAPVLLAPAASAVRSFRVIPRYIDPVRARQNPPASTNSRIGVHLHLYYVDLLDEMILRLRNIPYNFDLFVSVPAFLPSRQVMQIEQALRDGLDRARHIAIELTVNRGRDIAPFIIAFGDRLLGYDIVGHFHTK